MAVTVALQQSVPVRQQAIGNVEPYSSVAVKARVDGQLVAVNFREGQEVKRGDILFRIDARPFESALKQAEANALRDAAARDQARSQEQRYKELLSKNFVSKEAYAQIATNAQVAEATAGASQAARATCRRPTSCWCQSRGAGVTSSSPYTTSYRLPSSGSRRTISAVQ